MAMRPGLHLLKILSVLYNTIKPVMKVGNSMPVINLDEVTLNQLAPQLFAFTLNTMSPLWKV
jgi:hypothetical protein